MTLASNHSHSTQLGAAQFTEVRCPRCGRGPFKNIAAHWRQGQCSPPNLTAEQRAVVTGMLLTTGEIYGDSNSAFVEFYSDNSELVHWVAGVFGVLTKEATQTAENTYKWRSHSLSVFGKFVSVEPSRTSPLIKKYRSVPQTLTFVYAVAGNIPDGNTTSRPVIDLRFCAAESEEIEEMYSRFHPLTFTVPERGSEEVHLQDTKLFFESLCPPPLGCAEKWRPDITTLSPRPDTCDSCGVEYLSIEAHWKYASLCQSPLVPWKLWDIVQGALLAGASVQNSANGVRLVVSSQEEPVIEAFDRKMGRLSAGIRRTADGLTWYSRSLSDFARLAEWQTESGEVQIPSDFELSPQSLRMTYMLCGQNDSGKPTLRLSITRQSDTQIERLFEEFDPICAVDSVVLRDTAGFFDYIGWVPEPGCEDKWSDM